MQSRSEFPEVTLPDLVTADPTIAWFKDPAGNILSLLEAA